MLKVLVVEDEFDNREILKRQLQHLGYQVIGAASGPEGVRLALQERPDMIVLDIMMPGMDGCDVARRLRSEARLKETPILAATVLFQEEDIQNCLKAGCSEVLTKPITLQQLKESLDRLSLRLPRGE